MTEPLTSLCRNCLASHDDDLSGERCEKCGSPRIVRHSELHDLTIAHIDCDAFYASVEKRDNPSLADKPVIIGGGQRGVVAAACYVARLYGIRSAMPMFKAKQACPDAVVIRPNMAKYKAVGEQIRDLMREVTPLVQPLSIDEAFLDLTDVIAEGNDSAAMRLAALVLRIEQKIGVNASIGLSYNKFLAKIASDLDKPRGFAVIGRAEACDFLADKPVGMLWGVGRSLAGKLRRNGITKIGQLQQIEEQELVAKYGVIGSRLYHFARGNDTRKVEPNSQTKSISAETTFESDISDATALLERIVPLCRTVARRLENKDLAGQGVTVKLKQSDFRLLTRSRRLANPTQQAEAIYRAAKWLIEREADGRTFRLIGVGVDDLTDASDADPPDLFAATGTEPAI
ncbi:MAG: DNA polymerase IV [Pseudomonadota bacterium]|nr:DNA polymerase IV [Pseudomonadota bacterium]